MKAFFFSAIAACILAFNAIAQDNESTSYIPPQILVTPHVTPPQEVLATGLGGTVRVRVLIDAAGMVTAAPDVTGPDFTCQKVTRADVVAMREAARAAAMTAKFEPATDKGVAIASGTWMSFRFPGGDSMPDYTAANPSPAPAPGEKTTISAPIPETAGSKESDEKPVAGGSRTTLAGAGRPPVPVKGVYDVPKQINGGVVNGKATYLAKPPYPAAARAVKASGAVSVQVIIDEDGSVFASQAVAGHPLLRAASVAAACESRFSPTQLSGQPVRVAGVITYNFVP